MNRGPGTEYLAGPLTYFPSDAIVDAETGCLLRLISYIGDAPSAWWELDDLSTEPVDPDDFRVHVPPGTRVVEQTGNPITDFATGNSRPGRHRRPHRLPGRLSHRRRRLRRPQLPRRPPRPSLDRSTPR